VENGELDQKNSDFATLAQPFLLNSTKRPITVWLCSNELGFEY
jgi:hypothetical protein